MLHCLPAPLTERTMVLLYRDKFGRVSVRKGSVKPYATRLSL